VVTIVLGGRTKKVRVRTTNRKVGLMQKIKNFFKKKDK
jgi:hypothetical protein